MDYNPDKNTKLSGRRHLANGRLFLEQHYQAALTNNVWFSKLPQHFQDFIQLHSCIRVFDKDQTIFFSGDTFDGLYAVLEGSVYLGYVNIQGKQAVSAIVEPIMWFGEISLVDQQPRSHDAIALQKTTILYLAAHHIQRLTKEYPEFWFHIAQLTSQKLRYAFLELMSIQTQSLEQRLAQRLLLILNGYGNHLNIEHWDIHLSQEQLAHMMMCSRQTINQELQHLEKQGVLSIAFKKIQILDMQALKQIAQDQI